MAGLWRVYGGFLIVDQTIDNDMWIQVVNINPLNQIRFRTYFGGGKYEAVRVKLKELLIIMEEIEKENDYNRSMV